VVPQEQKIIVQDILDDAPNRLSQLSREVSIALHDSMDTNDERRMMINDGMDLITNIVDNQGHLQTIPADRLLHTAYGDAKKKWGGATSQDLSTAELIFTARAILIDAQIDARTRWEEISTQLIEEGKPLTPGDDHPDRNKWYHASKGEYELMLLIRGLDFGLQFLGLEADLLTGTLVPTVQKEASEIADELKGLPRERDYLEQQMERAKTLGES
jgi:hypothetical protein